MGALALQHMSCTMYVTTVVPSVTHTLGGLAQQCCTEFVVDGSVTTADA